MSTMPCFWMHASNRLISRNLRSAILIFLCVLGTRIHINFTMERLMHPFDVGLSAVIKLRLNPTHPDVDSMSTWYRLYGGAPPLPSHPPHARTHAHLPTYLIPQRFQGAKWTTGRNSTPSLHPVIPPHWNQHKFYMGADIERVHKTFHIIPLADFAGFSTV